MSWSPLAGLAYEGPPVWHDALGVHLTAMGSDAVVAMEEKDIRRDFIAKVRLGDPIAALAVVSPHAGSMVDEEHVSPLTRVRDLAVVGLRLAGLDAFVDPELLGWYVYDGSLRYRRETVLRQSIIMRIDAPGIVSIDPAALGRVQESWSLLATYERVARDAEIDRILDLYRRVHDRRFLPATTRALLAWIGLEATLGRFRSPKAKVRLETLSAALDDVPAEAVAWLQADGRRFRNALAHGDWSPEPMSPPEIWLTDYEPIARLLAISRAAVGTLLAIWVEADPPVRARHGPAGLLVKRLRQRIQ